MASFMGQCLSRLPGKRQARQDRRDGRFCFFLWNFVALHKNLLLATRNKDLRRFFDRRIRTYGESGGFLCKAEFRFVRGNPAKKIQSPLQKHLKRNAPA